MGAIHKGSDVKNDYVSSVIDHFYANGGSQTLIELCNFYNHEFEHLWNDWRQIFLMQILMLGKGRKADVAPKVLFFIVSCVLKATTNWDLMGEIFRMIQPTL